MHTTRILGGAALLAVALEASASCGAAFCLVNTDWSAQGAWAEGGVHFDVKYEFIDLDQPRAGRNRIAVGEIHRHHDEVETRNRNLVASLDWSLTPCWGLSVTAPLVDRKHFHIHNHQGEAIEDRWDFRRLGDVRVQARYQISPRETAIEAPRSWGITFGAKLPTGKYDVANSEGEAAERTLQPGSGTTDALLGAYWHGAALLDGWSWFTRVQAVVPLNTRADFKPGRLLQADVGARYAVNSTVGLMLQSNFQAKARDRGANAEPEDSGQRALYVSPGISWNASRNVQAYAFVQVPAYQSVNGVQLTADWSAVAGVSLRF